MSLTPFPCLQLSSSSSRIIDGQVDDYYPFFVATDTNTLNSGVILNAEYVMVYDGVPVTKIAYGIRPGHTDYTEAFSGPNVQCWDYSVQNIF